LRRKQRSSTEAQPDRKRPGTTATEAEDAVVVAEAEAEEELQHVAAWAHSQEGEEPSSTVVTCATITTERRAVRVHQKGWGATTATEGYTPTCVTPKLHPARTVSPPTPKLGIIEL
jgi:hypothetical protein